ncbi:pentapeptide repeat-containing protein [Xaviernesmea rhizosphaerae]|uniref:pentapeptide repeat-containing protein n=1 Tax=Xaviernesmea rhizosphaerae TaxID=1672749 RepID=UPI003CCA0D3E
MRARLNEANLTNTSLNQINFSSKLYNHCNMIGWFGTDVNLACSGFQDIKLSDVVFSAMPLCQRDALRRPPLGRSGLSLQCRTAGARAVRRDFANPMCGPLMN